MAFRADRLRARIDEMGVKTKELSEKVGVSTRMIRNYKAGTGVPDIEHLSLLADILKTNIDYLLDRSDYSGVWTDDHRRLAEAFDRGDRDAILDLIRQKALQKGRDKKRIPRHDPPSEA